MPKDQRVRQLGALDPGLVALHAQYGRCLLIASSRPGTQPPNLQGIWNHEVRAPWSSNWTININTEMNMWPAETTNLAECHEPLFDLIHGLAENGHKTARTNYGCGGLVAHHNTDVWRQSAPVGAYGQGDSTWALWPRSGPWLCRHLWRHYEFGGGKAFLRDTAYPRDEGRRRVLPRFSYRGRQGTPGRRPVHLAGKRFRDSRRQAFRGEHGQHNGSGADTRPVHAQHGRRKDPENR
jgi:alpha-L-fucosidase 2